MHNKTYSNVLTEQFIEQYPFTNLIHSTPHVYHSHTFWEISIIQTGSAINIMQNAPKKKLVRGDALILRPQDSHYIRPLTIPQEYTHRDVYISVEKFKSICNTLDPFLFETLQNAPLPPSFHLNEMELLNLNAHFNDFLIPDKKTAIMDSFHTALVAYILGLYLKSTSPLQNSIPSWLLLLLNNLQNPEVFTRKIPEIIETTHYSHSYVCSKFKYYMQKTLSEYLTELRMNYAGGILMRPNASVLETAMQLGYNSSTNFISAFKKHFGISPKQWKKQQLKKEE